MVELAEVPALAGTGVEADMLKSQNWKTAVEEWTNEPLVPVSVRV